MAAARDTRDVVVVGAGAAGLSAAVALARRELRVTILESRPRVGGRIHTCVDPVLGLAVEHGAEFVHGRPERTLALARRAGVRVRQIPDRHQRRRGARLVDVGAAFAAGEELLGRGTRDDEPFSAVLRRARATRAPAEAATLAADFVQGFYLADPRRASSLALARMTRALDAVHGDVMSRVEGGYAHLLEPLVAELRRRGADLRLSTAVEEIRWRPGEVHVRSRGAAGSALAPLRARAAVVTVPVAVLASGDTASSPRCRSGAGRGPPSRWARS